jgi:hypothetical protein
MEGNMSLVRKLTGFLIAGVLIFSVGAGVLAQQQQAPSSGLRISPTRTELVLDKGKTADIEVSLKNVSGGDIIAKAEVNDFDSEGETGEPKILVNSTEPTGNSVKPFLSGISDVPLKKDESKTVKIGVKIPSDASAGAYYGILRYSAEPTSGEAEPGNLSLTASVASLVLIEVPGEITEQIQVNDILLYDNVTDTSSSLFFTKPPAQSGVRITNNGNSFSKPFGKVSVKRTLGNKEVYSYELNNTTPRNNVLPNSTRIFRDDIKNVSVPGRYTITAGVSHGKSGEVITKQVSFWYLPIWVIVVLVGILLLAILGIFLLIRKLRKSSRLHLRNR